MREMAKHVGLVPRTLRRLRASWRREHLHTKPRGRPTTVVEHSVRQAVIMVLAFLGPEVGIPTLEWVFPHVSRSVLTDLLGRYRKLAHLNLRSLLHVLVWHRVGAVWAADFCTPPLPIDGLYKRLFNVRDLASGAQLMSLPVFDESAATVLKALEVLIRWCGIPLVLKLDNGSAFIAHETRAWAEAHGIKLLYSPPVTPAYNGSIEAGTGSIETRAYHHAARHGRPWEWTCDDVEWARLQANETGRPHGRNGPTPDEAWAEREAIRDDEREAFGEAYRRLEAAEREQRLVQVGVHLQRHEQAGIDRVALGRALIELGFLSIRRRRITPRIPKRKADRIS
jgi:transposase InsO family protein